MQAQQMIDSVRATFAQFGWWTMTQWRVAAIAAAVALVAIGEVGQTLPPAWTDRVYPIEWWNYVTLVADSALIGLVLGSFLAPAGRRLATAGSSGVAGMLAAIMMACPICSPLAIPLLGAGGVLAFLRGDRGWLALASVLVLAATLYLRLRATSSCPVRFEPPHGLKSPT
jgi:hypothetical protein